MLLISSLLQVYKSAVQFKSNKRYTWLTKLTQPNLSKTYGFPDFFATSASHLPCILVAYQLPNPQVDMEPLEKPRFQWPKVDGFHWGLWLNPYFSSRCIYHFWPLTKHNFATNRDGHEMNLFGKWSYGPLLKYLVVFGAHLVDTQPFLDLQNRDSHWKASPSAPCHVDRE